MSIKPVLLVAAGLLPLAGCVGHHHHYDEGPVVTVEPAPSGYVYYSDPGYYGGYYDHDYWYWHDRDGHMHREFRAEHERRVREHPAYERREGDRDRERH
jgi:hypothetical protein